MSLTGGKRKANKSLKAWVTFVKKVQREEKLSYKDAIHRAKVRKDKGEKWMVGGQTSSEETMGETMGAMTTTPTDSMTPPTMELVDETVDVLAGGKRRRTMRRGRGRTQQQQQQRQRGRTQRRRQQQQRHQQQQRRQQRASRRQ